MNVFNRYAPFIQDYITAPVADASGRTKCCRRGDFRHRRSCAHYSLNSLRQGQRRQFFPILTLLDENPPASVGVIYRSAESADQ